MKLSFIIPVYKTEHILKRVCHALAEQSLKDFEAIFVLDGPSPLAREHINTEFHGHPVEPKIIEIEHGGACRARNEGAKHATGEYWVFWDSDCIIEPGTAQMWVEQLDKKQDIDFIYSGYRFLDEKGAIASEPFDPWLLRVSNYISACFPFRAKLFPGWDESLKSLQDWDFWLSIVEKGGKGLAIKGYAFATEYPTPSSISGQGCTQEAWLSRMDAVRKKHGIQEKRICVSSVQYKQDGIRLAKLLDADYRDYPNFKPHRYEVLIQLGFSPLQQFIGRHSETFSAANNETVKKRIVFWTSDNILDIYKSINFDAICAYSASLNEVAIQYVEDKKAYDMMRKAGFNVEVLPIPMELPEVSPLPDKPRFLVYIEARYGRLMVAIDRSLPDVELDVVGDGADVSKYHGIIHLFPDRTISTNVKTALINSRHVISNIQQPFCGFVDDCQNSGKFIEEVVGKVRTIIKNGKSNDPARDYHGRMLSPERFLEAVA